MNKLIYSLAIVIISSLKISVATPYNNPIPEQPLTIVDRPGLYRVTLSAEIAEKAFSSLRNILGKNHPAFTKTQECFENYQYPHPNQVTYVRPLWKGFKQIVDELRDSLKIDDQVLPYFSSEEYSKLANHTEAIAAFGAYIHSKLTE